MVISGFLYENVCYRASEPSILPEQRRQFSGSAKKGADASTNSTCSDHKQKQSLKIYTYRLCLK